MADKGFELKVMIPTEDGISVSSEPIEKSPYFLMYNLSNRSYQLAGNLKARELLSEGGAIKPKLKKIIEKEKVDVMIGKFSIVFSGCKFLEADDTEINKILHDLIDKIDQKEELF